MENNRRPGCCSCNLYKIHDAGRVWAGEREGGGVWWLRLPLLHQRLQGGETEGERQRERKRERMATVTSFGLGLSPWVNCEIKVSKCVHQDFLMDGIFCPHDVTIRPQCRHHLSSITNISIMTSSLFFPPWCRQQSSIILSFVLPVVTIFPPWRHYLSS